MLLHPQILCASDVLADNILALELSNTEKEELVWTYSMLLDFVSSYWVMGWRHLPGPAVLHVSHHTHTHGEQRWLSGVDINQDWGSGCRCQLGAHPSCCWFFWASEWWTPVSRSDTSPQLLFQPLSERQGGDVQARGETHKHHTCQSVKSEGGGGEHGSRRGGAGVPKREPHRPEDSAAHKEYLGVLDCKQRHIFQGIKVGLRYSCTPSRSGNENTGNSSPLGS